MRQLRYSVSLGAHPRILGRLPKLAMGTGIIIYLLVSLSACDAFRAGAARLTASPRLATAQRSARSGLVVANSPREADDSSDDSSAYSVDWDSALQKELRARAEGNAACVLDCSNPIASST